MRIILPFVFEKLKQQILDQAGIKVIAPGDCKFLSARISGSTNKQISDTTLKRIYGFTFSKFLPSLYTLNTLAEYCGYAGWEDFSSKQKGGDTEPAAAATEDVASVETQALNLSQKTLQALINRSVVPYNLTVKRDFIAEHLEIFSHSNHTATLLTAPAGYGKTIGLCHWVEEQLGAIIKGSNDVMLFLSSKMLSAQPQSRGINEWLKALMGFDDQGNSLPEIFEDDRTTQRKFYLVIDGFDKDNFKAGDYELLTEMLLDVIALYRNRPNFKVILTMRSANWLSIRNRLLIESSIGHWFLGFMQDSSQETNMLLFGAEEIKTLSTRINPLQPSEQPMSSEVASLFSYPLFFQYYYQKYPAKFSLNNLDYFGIYEVISSYFMDKIYSARFSTEKVLVIRLLLKNGVVQDGNFIVDKLRVYDQMKDLWEAYSDMISLGLLREVNRSTDAAFIKSIEFANKRLVAYCIARSMAYDNGSLHDAQLIDKIDREVNEAYRLPVLKWCIFNAIKVQQFGIFKHLTRINLCAAEKIYLLKFLINLTQHKYLSMKSSGLIKHSFCRENPDLFYYFFGIEFISPDYKEVLQKMLTLELEDTSKIWVHTGLAVIGIVQLDNVAIEKGIEELRKFPEHTFFEFGINPLYCIDTIYTFFKYGIVKKEALSQITRFYFNPPSQSKFLATFCSSNIMYMLALSTLSISNNKHKVLRFIKVLESYPVVQRADNMTFNFFLQVTKSDALLTLGKEEEGIAIYTDLLEKFSHMRHTYTPYMNVCLDLVTAKVKTFRGEEAEAQVVIEKVMQASVKHRFNYIEAYVIASYLAMPELDTSSDFYKTANYRFIKMIRGAGLNISSFCMNYRSEPAYAAY